MATYPTGIKIYLDGQDITMNVTGQTELNPSDAKHEWRNLDITNFIKGPGIHRIEITAADGVGRAEARVEIK